MRESLVEWWSFIWVESRLARGKLVFDYGKVLSNIPVRDDHQDGRGTGCGRRKNECNLKEVLKFDFTFTLRHYLT